MSGQAVRAVVVAAEETHPRLHAVLSELGMLGTDSTAAPIAEGAVALVVETPQEARRRGARTLARVEGTHLQWPKGARIVDGLRAAKACDAWGAQRSGQRIVADTGAAIGKIERRAVGLGEPTAGPQDVERHAVGPLYSLAKWAVKANRGADQAILLAADESGGAGGVHLS